MVGARSLLLIALAGVAIPADWAAAQTLFPFLGSGSPPPQTETYLPPDADPNYSTPGGFDKDVDMHLTTRKEVSDPTGEPAGTVTINTHERKLYLSLGDGRARPAGASRRWDGEPARRAGPLFVSRQERHLVSHPRHQ